MYGRGMGRGNGRNRRNQGLGIQGTCYCSNCGYETSHQRGIPCYEMKCPSCGNPLTRKELNTTMKPTINQNTCIGCGKCQNVCPVDAITIENGKANIDIAACAGCRRCVNVCPVNAID
ncbi:DUF362 domain-containing protein [Caldisalinibacter kiritimatiensis]|uniref:Iron-sulfur cluster-binding protein n=1 Tax=Caldisalinibacter kiritimatiensis TaxID=1304284 RepID=R1CQ83_9FIRM|nr:4Fe-4S dicluster domain-containing protein [Caldisalinibacter kiritimatiensis]EOD00836.1 iron-sulfur cluster-binding protein [Caldisalinibacter kiritimatiensis]